MSCQLPTVAGEPLGLVVSAKDLRSEPCSFDVGSNAGVTQKTRVRDSMAENIIEN